MDSNMATPSRSLSSVIKDCIFHVLTIIEDAFWGLEHCVLTVMPVSTSFSKQWGGPVVWWIIPSAWALYCSVLMSLGLLQLYLWRTCMKWNCAGVCLLNSSTTSTFLSIAMYLSRIAQFCMYVCWQNACYGMVITVFLPGLKGGKVLIWGKGTFVRGLSFLGHFYAWFYILRSQWEK